jgi:hypothetical protein
MKSSKKIGIMVLCLKCGKKHLVKDSWVEEAGSAKTADEHAICYKLKKLCPEPFPIITLKPLAHFPVKSKTEDFLDIDYDFFFIFKDDDVCVRLCSPLDVLLRMNDTLSGFAKKMILKKHGIEHLSSTYEMTVLAVTSFLGHTEWMTWDDLSVSNMKSKSF